MCEGLVSYETGMLHWWGNGIRKQFGFLADLIMNNDNNKTVDSVFERSDWLLNIGIASAIHLRASRAKILIVDRIN